ncbi:MAG: hypothetical protein ACRDL2_11815, partial [Gaiellaceae bacterium]
VYAGLAGDAAVAGVGARITPLPSVFQVRAGHVAGWVGVGGPGEGPGGADEWIQVGFSAFPGSVGNDIYYEVARPGSPITYHRVRAAVAPGVSMRLSVLEVHGRLDWWRVWVDGSPVSAPIHLPASHERWRPVVTAESWDGGTPACNDFLYQFGAVRIASSPGGTWHPLTATTPIGGPSTIVLHRDGGTFDAAGGPVARRTLAESTHAGG